jgi:hypothetical protein
MALMYTPAPDTKIRFPKFELPTVYGETFKSSSVPADHCKVLLFICNHCPYVKAVEDRLIELANSFKSQKVSFIAVCSNDWTEHPEDSPKNLATHAQKKGYPFPYLVDENQTLAKTVDAVCTPDFFVFSANGELTYRGRLDDSWKNPKLVKRRELYEAINNTLRNTTVTWDIVPSMGCSIKWKETH